MIQNSYVTAQGIQLKSIVLEHTNPSMGPYEKIVTLNLKNTPETEKRIEQFLNESVINGVMSIGEYILAHRNENHSDIEKVETGKCNQADFNEGQSISHLVFYFSDGYQQLKIYDIYREYEITQFNNEFTKYMIENGDRSEWLDGRVGLL